MRGAMNPLPKLMATSAPLDANASLHGVAVEAINSVEVRLSFSECRFRPDGRLQQGIDAPRYTISASATLSGRPAAQCSRTFLILRLAQRLSLVMPAVFSNTVEMR